MSRDFQNDFLVHALKALSPQQQKRVGLALDCAIAFGALEAQQGNDSLKDGPELQKAYREKCARLQSGRY
jgi:hypothetical protein